MRFLFLFSPRSHLTIKQLFWLCRWSSWFLREMVPFKRKWHANMPMKGWGGSLLPRLISLDPGFRPGWRFALKDFIKNSLSKWFKIGSWIQLFDIGLKRNENSAITKKKIKKNPCLFNLFQNWKLMEFFTAWGDTEPGPFNQHLNWC